MLRKYFSYVFFTSALLFSFVANAQGAHALSDLFHRPGDPVAGNPTGSVTVVEFFDYQCGHCVNMTGTNAAIINKNPNVRFVFKEYPIRGEMSETLSRAALAANKQGKYYRFHHALMVSRDPLTDETIFAIAKRVGLNVAKLKKDMVSGAISNQLRANMALGSRLNVTGTPAFFIGPSDASSNDQVNFVLGELTQGEMQKLINKSAG